MREEIVVGSFCQGSRYDSSKFLEFVPTVKKMVLQHTICFNFSERL